MLLAQNLTVVRSGRVVLDSLDLHVGPREIVALVGDEAAGKSTALECFAGRHRPVAGSLRAADIDPVRSPELLRSLVAHVPPQLSFPADARVIRFLRDRCNAEGRTMPDPVLRAALTRGGIDEVWQDQLIGRCPVSVRRKLAFVLATLRNPVAFLLDDPTCDLEPADIEALVVGLRRLRKAGAAILLATRDIPFAHRLATRVVLLERGVAVEAIELNVPRNASAANVYLAELVA
jgi:ABC-2 type transport system ATP-binding protein